ncbi:MAG: RNA polymerase subunit sigma [Oceanospirillaceae bacterium]|uniref:sigma-70 family RNA polymerase sigma factor n=1 Tax=unclassified Thalassolituus TaxID=2624967 RepID=UPI000C381CD2|nr:MULTISPECIES: sigma-70 family RNA polymerase sigma factor [unclassified Thalassolituus]MBS53051.1 RNA polymerase subunit sigma [Oceanospirillaceae bacterium]
MITTHDISQWVHQWRTPMLRFAQLHLSSADDAEDAVQETFAALVTFTGNKKPDDIRAYLFGILRNKVKDRLRQRYRQPLADEISSDEFDELLFDRKGHWHSGVAPARWSAPDEDTESSQFFKVLDICVNKLPEKPARVFTMKEFMECDAEEICTIINISKSDYWQSMSRARKQIHICLNQSWFDGETLS